MHTKGEKLEVLNKELENKNNSQTELKNITIHRKNVLEKINSRLNKSEEWISELEDRLMEITKVEQNKGKRMKRNKNILRESCRNSECSNICITGVPEREKKEGLRKYSRANSLKLP